MHRMLLVYQSSYRHLNQYVEPLSPLSRFATNVLSAKTQILSLTVSFFLQTDTNKNQQLHHFLSTYARNTLCLSRFPFSIHPTILLYNTVPNYHRWSLQLPIRSDRTARHSTLSFNISPVLALVLVTSAWTTINSTSISYFLQPWATTTTLSLWLIKYYSYNHFFGTILSQRCPAYL